MDIGNPFAVASQPSLPINNNPQPQMSQNNPFINQMFGSYNNFQAQFNEFAAQIQQAQQNPQQLVQHLINSGRMSPQQFEALRQQANQLMGTHF
jgi:hypothetical protein